MNRDDHERINALTAAQRWDAALDEVDRVLARTPDDATALATRAYVLLNLARAGEALEATDRALAVRPTAVWPLLLRATALRFLGRRGDALTAAESAAARAPLDLGVRLELARCQLVARKRKDAVQTATATLADHPASVAAWIVVGETRLGRDNAGAVDAYRSALAIDPTSAAATNGLGAAYQALGKRREAAEMYTQAARLDPHATAPRRNLEQLVVGFGGLGVAAVVSARVLGSSSPATALAVAAMLAVIAVPVIALIRRRRLAVLPAEARAFVESQRRARWRKLRDPRTWPATARAAPRPLFVVLCLAGAFMVLVVVAPGNEPDRRPRLEPEDFELPSVFTLLPPPVPAAPLVVVVRCADGSTIPAGADSASCDG